MRKAAKEEMSELKLEQNCAKQVRTRGPSISQGNNGSQAGGNDASSSS